MKNKAVVIATIVSIGLFLAAVAVGIAFYQTKKPQKTVSVVVLLEKDFTSDLIVWEFNYSAESSDMKDAYSKLKEQNEVVKAYLKNANIDEKEIVKTLYRKKEKVKPNYKKKKNQEVERIKRKKRREFIQNKIKEERIERYKKDARK